MTEQWQHMLVSAIASPNAQFISFPSTEAVQGLTPSASSTIALLNELGEQGWQLVGAEPGSDFRTGRYWLKRRVQYED